jgi:hypothetical protein
MLHPTGRLIAFAILHQSYSSQPVNPYVPLLLDVSSEPCFPVIFDLDRCGRTSISTSNVHITSNMQTWKLICLLLGLNHNFS